MSNKKLGCEFYSFNLAANLTQDFSLEVKSIEAHARKYLPIIFLATVNMIYYNSPLNESETKTRSWNQEAKPMSDAIFF